MGVLARSLTNHATVDNELCGPNPRRVSLMFQAVDKAPIAIYPENGKLAPIVLATPYSSFSFNTEHFRDFGRWYAVNDADGPGIGLATIRITETSA